MLTFARDLSQLSLIPMQCHQAGFFSHRYPRITFKRQMALFHSSQALIAVWLFHVVSFGFGPENVGLIFPMIASHLKTGFHDQQNHWVQWGTQPIFRHTQIRKSP